MMIRLWLLLASVALIGSADETSPILKRMPDIIQEFCPGVNVCRENRSSEAAEKLFSPGLVPTSSPCCTECSCGSDCEEAGNCCFRNKLQYNQENDRELQFSQRQHTCLYPITVQPEFAYRSSFQSYKMVSKVPEKVLASRKTVLNTSCGDEIVAPWGSLYPVYSPKYKQIYKNMACATADGVTDGNVWDAVLFCPVDISDTTDTIINVIGFDSDSISDNCTVYFIYPGSLNDINPLKCYATLIDTCPDSEFQLPDVAGVSKEHIIELCTSGLVSPYRRRNMYANVFCHICNAESFRQVDTCRKDSLIPSRVRGEFEFLGLLDGEFIKQKHQEQPPELLPLACDINHTSRCRRVFCPSAKVRDNTGECIYPYKAWYSQEYTVYINLTSTSAFNFTEVLRVKLDLDTNILPPFTIPWPQNWFIKAIYYELMDETTNGTTFIIVLTNKISMVHTDSLMQTIKRMIARKWLLEHDNVTLDFNSGFTTFKVKDIRQREIEFESGFSNLSENFGKRRYLRIYGRGAGTGNVFVITKLYTCNQVELKQSEFILGPNGKTLFNIITQRFLSDAEFILLTNHDCPEARARICIDDSGLYITNTNVFQKAGAFRCIFDIRFIGSMLLFRPLVKYNHLLSLLW